LTIRVAINHITEYRFDRPITLHPHVVRLRPSPHCRTAIESYSLKVSPTNHFLNWQQDPFGNYLARYVFPEKTRELLIHVELIADLTVINPFDFFLEENAETIPFQYESQLRRDLDPYLEVKESGPLLTEWLAAVDRSATPTVNFLVALNQRLMADVGYLIRMEPGVQSCEQTLLTQSGSCRDSAWLMVQILRHLGLAARFVSGYLVQLKSDQQSLDGPSGPVEDFTDLHAWAEVYLPGAGWIGLDATSGLFAGEGHIPLACTPDPISAAPVTGATERAEVTFHFENSVTRIFEDARVTKPYTDMQWRKVEKLALKIDQQLALDDVRLTMGGEPTFVSIDNMDGAQWNTEALGDEKRKLADSLFWRLKQHYAPQGLMHIGQGKWYPGEQLPRWALSLYWRKDRKPLWLDDALLANESSLGQQPATAGKDFVDALAKQLGLSPELVVPGFEDVGYYLWKEGQLPENLDPDNNKLDDPLERARFRRLFATGLTTTVGYALPLKWQTMNEQQGRWRSSRWPFRSRHMLLVPGDSPMGLRLPLNSLPWEQPNPLEFDAEADPFAPVSAELTSLDSVESKEVIHTALCVQVREGHLYVFMPPQTEFDIYALLLAKIEATAKQLAMPVIIEGYEPPSDHASRDTGRDHSARSCARTSY